MKARTKIHGFTKQLQRLRHSARNYSPATPIQTPRANASPIDAQEPRKLTEADVEALERAHAKRVERARKRLAIAYRR